MLTFFHKFCLLTNNGNFVLQNVDGGSIIAIYADDTSLL